MSCARALVIHRFIVHTRARARVANHDFDFDFHSHCTNTQIFWMDLLIASVMPRRRGSEREREGEGGWGERKSVKNYVMIWLRRSENTTGIFSCSSQQQHILLISTICLRARLVGRCALCACTERCSLTTNLTFVCSWKRWWLLLLLLFKFPNSNIHAHKRQECGLCTAETLVLVQNVQYCISTRPDANTLIRTWNTFVRWERLYNLISGSVTSSCELTRQLYKCK